ncbi:hypothetical protein [Dyella tabacisoli]|uniref:Uncharacterized protein n=1 Tax=Dyella tabacisoli TaxID=2282381 RepID=A0A369UQ42_9GAMM|nr:hypothetical protein [Dyella tabacisoli]RDD82443.1 hypothetical protein DVJ77_05700 [Dyella tabacisoli]
MKLFLGSKLLFALVLLTVYSADAFSREQNPVVAEAAGVTIGNGHVALNIRFWNCTDKAITLDHSFLPWGQRATGLIVYKGAGVGKELEPIYLVDDLPPRDVTIGSGEFATGALNLEETFPALRKAKHLDDLVVFWVYDAKMTGIPSAGKFGGMVPLSHAPSTSDSNASACR